jgi:two-component system response regulator
MNVKDYNETEVVLIEDNPEDAELTVRTLKKHNLANNIYTLEDGAEGLDFIFCRGKYAGRNISLSPRVVLLDLKLPKVSGLELLRVVKQDARTRKIPIIIVSSSREDPDIKTAYDLGANGYVVKPVDFEAFTDAMIKLGLYWLLVNQPPK